MEKGRKEFVEKTRPSLLERRGSSMKKKNAKFWIAVALALCLISSVGASIAQTAGGKIQYHDVTLVGDSGHELDACC